MPKIVTVLLLAAGAASLAVCQAKPTNIGSQGDPVPRGVVVINNSSFAPHVVTIHAGQTVTWEWNDGLVPHNVTFDNSGAHSPTQANGRWSHTFDTAGTYHYRCTIHNNMDGYVVVE